MKKILALLLAAVMLLGVVGATAEVTDLPRNETVYMGGNQWGSINGYNPLSSNMNNGLILSAAPRGTRTVMFETLYMYNALDGKLYPLLADGDYVWNDDLTEMTVKIKAAAKWSDGTALTAEVQGFLTGKVFRRIGTCNAQQHGECQEKSQDLLHTRVPP